jgi:hypothetical protein
MTTRSWSAIVVVTLAAGCSRQPDVEKVPVGSEVQVTRQDGGVVQGTLKNRDEEKVNVDTGRVTRTVRRDQIADVRLIDNRPDAKPPVLPAIAKFREYTVPDGTRLTLELQSALSSETSRVEDPVEARLETPIRVEGIEVLPAGARVHGVVTGVQEAGKVKGRATLAMRFNRVTVGDESYVISAPFAVTAPSTKREDAEKIGLPAAGGAIIGAIIGGKKGAAIGGAIGGGAGTAHVLMTEGKDVGLGAGTNIAVTLQQPIDVRVPISPSADRRP